jgi:long-chain acyl-CoA synthetase
MLVPDLLERHAKERPAKAALVYGERALSYRELNAEVGRLASGLRRDAAAGEPCALWLPNGPELLCLILACLRSGVVAMPLHHDMKRPEVEGVLARGGVKRLVTGADYPERRGDPRSGGTCVRSPEDPCLVLLTSGSKGLPKSVVLSVASVEHILRYRLEHTMLSTESVSVVASCLSQSVGLYQSLALVAAGATIVLLDDYDPDRLVDALHRHRPTHLIMVVEAFDRLLHHPKISPESVRSLVFASVGADRVTDRVQRRFVALTGQPLRVSYGLTESSWALVNSGERLDKCLALGKPGPGTELRLRDAAGRDVAPGEVGEIHIKSPRTMLGYLHDDASTRDVLADGWLASGDLARRDDEGWYWFAGRKKSTIVLPSGDNVSPAEVEDALLCHPGVSCCAVVGVDASDGGTAVWALVVRENGEPPADAIRAFLRERLSDYKIPARIVFVPRLPVGLTGKIRADDVLKLVEP